MPVPEVFPSPARRLAGAPARLASRRSAPALSFLVLGAAWILGAGLTLEAGVAGPAAAAAPAAERAARRATRDAAAPAADGPAAVVAQARAALGLTAEDRGAPRPDRITHRPRERAVLDPLAEAVADGEATGLEPAALAGRHVALGDALARMYRDREAAAAYARALDLAPAHVAGWVNLGGVLRRLGLHRSSEAALRRGLDLEPAAGLGHFSLAMTLAAQGRFVESDAAYRRALDLDPSLWVPARNPAIIGNARARRALHGRYMERQGAGTVLVMPPASPAPPPSAPPAPPPSAPRAAAPAATGGDAGSSR